MKLEGLKEIQKALAKLPDELKRTTEMAALRDGAKPILQASKQYAKSSEDEGDLIKSLGLNVRKGKSGSTKGIYTARVGVRKGFSRVVNGKKKDPFKYAHLVELGTVHSQAQPFIRPAIDSSQNQIIPAMAKGYERGLTRAVAKLKK